MAFKVFNTVIKQTKDEMCKLNKEYEDLRINNIAKSKKIRDSIEEKSNKFKQRRNYRNKYFEIIRSK